VTPARQAWLARPYSIPRSLRPWLSDRSSLTRRLKSHCSTFRVLPLRTGLAHANRDELALLGLPALGKAYVRDVLLLCDEVPVVYAHSVLSRASLQGPWRGIGRLGSRPLGEALFGDPRIKRQSLACQRLRPDHPLYRVAVAQHTEMRDRSLWARRSVFCLDRHPLLVTEVFLPASDVLCCCPNA
jgi:chorismate--pyruvate lyase